MMQTYLVNVLIFCGIILLLVLTVAAVQGGLILIDIRKSSKEIKNKIVAAVALLDIAALIRKAVKTFCNKKGGE